MSLKKSELILNDDGSIYHLNLKPENLAQTIITVGDPDRVETVTQYFDSVEFKTCNREFHTQTGTYKGKRISVVSTGIGTDNIDIVFNELDALVNIDFKTRTVKKKLTSLRLIRIGTSGSLHESIPVNSFLLSEAAIGFDSLLHYYKDNEKIREHELENALQKHLKLPAERSTPYIVKASESLTALFLETQIMHTGITATNVGFYAPQGRILRAPAQDDQFLDKLESFHLESKKITNLEMETSGIYALAALLGHEAISLNAIIANRSSGKFSDDPKQITEKLITIALNRIAKAEFI